MKVEWTPLAQADLLSAVQYVLREDPRAARMLRDRIMEAAEHLAVYPEAGRPGRVKGTREQVVTGTSYILPYRQQEDVLQILRVLHAARRWPGKFVN